MSLRSQLALMAGRASAWGLKNVARRNASQLPGRVALSLDPQLLRELAPKATKGSIVVCGTNGKTTTNNMLAAAVEASGQSVLCNRAGANMLAGVVAAMLPGTSADWAVMEADELSCKHILPQLRPTYLVLLNLFRDQLDRAGEIDHVQDTIVNALAASPTTTLVVCADDPLCAGIARRAAQAGTRVISFGIGEDLGLEPDRVPEARFCQVCGAELDYDYRAYAQLGAFRCPNGDFERAPLDYAATGVTVSREGVAFQVTGSSLPEAVQVKASFGGVYMVYNLMAAFVGSLLAGTTPEQFQRAIDAYDPKNGRLQHFRAGGRDVILNLAKNPTGFNQNISLLQADDRPKHAFFVINDNANDGHDISWIWDVDYERLNSEKSLVVYAGGSRAGDVAVRCKYAGLDARPAHSVSEVLGRMASVDPDVPLYVLTNYSALWPAKAELEKIGERA